jgi:ribose/xylose/arabinose/galactoside ABC-type transport system permease subunit
MWRDRRRWFQDARQYGIVIVLLLAVVGAVIGVPDFNTEENLGNVVTQSAALGVLAIGQTFVILCGLIDLSVGQLLGLIVVLSCDFSAGRPEWFVAAIAMALGLGAVSGAITGVLNNWLRVHPLILTFGLLSVLQGVIFLYTDRSVGQAPPQFAWLANGRLGGLPAAGLVLALLTTTAHLVLTRTAVGRHVCAVGGSEENARRAGINTHGVKLFAFVISGVSAGLAAVLVAGRLGTGFPNAGTGYELDAVVAVVLGGTSLAGGAGNVICTVAAAFVLGLISNTLNLLQISAFVQILVKGLIVIGAILFNQPVEEWP